MTFINPARAARAGRDAARARDWAQFPAVVVRHKMPKELYALGDVHDGYQRMSKLLHANGFMDRADVRLKGVRQLPDGSFHVRWNEPPKWTGGEKTLVITGDLIDKGTQPLETLLLLMELKKQAGDNLIITLGNHEQTFLAGTHSSRHRPLHRALKKAGIPLEDVIGGRNALGKFLTRLPVMALFEDAIALSHSGYPGKRTAAEIEQEVRHGLRKTGFGHPVLAAPDSIVNDRTWLRAQGKVSKKEETPIETALTQLGVKMIAFGHMPGKIEFPGGVKRDKFAPLQYETDFGSLVPMDNGMSVGGDALLYRFVRKGEDIRVQASDASKKTGFEPIPREHTDVFESRAKRLAAG